MPLTAPSRRLAAPSRRRLDLVVGLAIFALPFVVLGHALRPGVVMSPADILLTYPPWAGSATISRPANPLLTDTTFMTHPALLHAASEIRAGRFPLWNPHAFTGAPFFANPQTALLFPLTALAYLLPPAIAITLGSILKISVAGVSMYWALRVMTLLPLAAALGAVAFLSAGMLTVLLQWSAGSALALVPLVFGATEWLRHRPCALRIAALAAAVGVSVLAGYPQITAQAIGLGGAWLLVRGRATPRWPRVALAWAGGVALGGALAAVQVLPFLEYLRESSVYFYRSQWSPIVQLPLRSAVAMLMPYYFGSHVTRDFWGYWNFVEMTTTVGLVPLALVPAALVAARRRADAAFFLAVALAAWSIVYGVVPARVVAALPGLMLFITIRLAAAMTFALAALAAVTLDAMTRTTAAERRLAARLTVPWLVVLVAVALALVLDDAPTFARMRLAIPATVQYAVFVALLTIAALIVLRVLRVAALSPAGITVLAAVELAQALPMVLTVNPVIDRRRFYPPAPPAIAYVQATLAREPGRVLLPTPPSVGVVYRLDEAAGYDGMTPRRIEQLASVGSGVGLFASGPLAVRVPPASPAFDLLGLRHVVTAPREPPPAPGFELAYDGVDARVYRNPGTQPRAFLVFRARCADDATALRLVQSAGVDLRDEVVLAECDAVRPPATGGRRSVVRVEASGADLVVETDADAPAYLVVTDTWFPGWRARIGDADHPVLRANHAFRAVWLPAGRHRVGLTYRPPSFLWGLAASGIALALTIGLVVIGRRA